MSARPFRTKRNCWFLLNCRPKFLMSCGGRKTLKIPHESWLQFSLPTEFIVHVFEDRFDTKISYIFPILYPKKQTFPATFPAHLRSIQDRVSTSFFFFTARIPSSRILCDPAHAFASLTVVTVQCKPRVFSSPDRVSRKPAKSAYGRSSVVISFIYENLQGAAR